MDQAQQRHVLGLDLIRFAAAAMVMVFHYGHDIGPIPLSWPGWVGVEVFFVLSGYVISASAEGTTPGRFARSRIVRLMPAVWICSSAVAIVCALQGTYPDLVSRYWRSMVLWPTGPWVDGVLWTLPVEIVFYALVFSCLLAKVPLGWLLRAIAAISFAYWGTRLASQLHVLPATASDSVPEAFARLSMLAFGCYFAVGGLLREVSARKPRLELFGFFALAVTGSAIQIAFAASNWAAQGPLAGLSHSGKIVPLLIWMGLVVSMAASVAGNSWAWRFAAPMAPAVRLIGLATYPIYLLHDVVGNALKWTPSARTSLVGSALTIAIGVVFAATLEPTVQGGLKRILRSPTVEPQPAFQLEDEPS